MIPATLTRLVTTSWTRLRATPAEAVLVGLSAVALGLLATPLLLLLTNLVRSSESGWTYLFVTVLPGMLGNTIALALGVALLTSTMGVTSAWLVTMCRFPGRRFFEWALILPLAIPAYVLAYAYADWLQHAGPVQGFLRDVTGWGPNDYWFPNIRSLPGAVVVMSLVLYPYVYLMARVGFLELSADALEASRVHGCSPFESFRRVALPLARPSIIAGLGLALMETLADFGTVAHFSVQTFTTGIYRAWLSLGDRVLAGQLASILFGVIVLVLLVERMGRAGGRGIGRGSAHRPLPGYELTGVRRWLAVLGCTLPILFGFALPVVILLEMAVTQGHSLFGPRYVTLTLNSFTLAGVTALVAVALGLTMIYAARISHRRWLDRSLKIAALGYAVPGSIIAVAILVPLAALDNAVDAWAREALGVSTGLILSGTIVALVYGYLVRFMAVPLQGIEASMKRVTPNMDAAARSLGRQPLTVLAEIHVPLIRGGLLTTGLIVFVDVMKELPATLIMRPFNFDTLAIQAYRLASDERLAEASTASLVIVAVGLLPVILLSRSIQKSRVGGP